MRISQDTVTAIVLLLLCGGFWAATYQVPDMGYQTMGSVVWPRIILAVLAIMSLIYLVTSLRTGPDQRAEQDAGRKSGIVGWFRHHRNPIICFALFFLFLVTLPLLGMLLGGVAFVFLLLTILGDRSPRAIVLHAAIAIAMVGAMWSVFTFALRVILPAGAILPAI